MCLNSRYQLFLNAFIREGIQICGAMSMFPKCKHELAALEKRNLQNESGQPDVSKRIGIAKGKLKAPDDIDANGEEAAAMLMEGDL